jgi:hypothetical protein
MSNELPDCLTTACQAICLTLAAFALPAAGGDLAKANALIADMILAHQPANMMELELAGRIVGFSLAAMDNLRMSIADPEMADAKVLRCRSSAASLSRSAEQCRAALTNLRAGSKPQQPAAVTQQREAQPEAPQPEAPQPEAAQAEAPKAAAPKPRPVATAGAPDDDAKQDAYASLVPDRIDRLHDEWASGTDFDRVQPANAPNVPSLLLVGGGG